MDPVVSQFVLGAVVPGAVSTVTLGLLWFGTTRRRVMTPCAALTTSNAQVTDTTLVPGSTAAISQANAPRLRAAGVPFLATLAVVFAQSKLVTNGWSFPPVDAYGWLGTLAVGAGAVGCATALSRTPFVGVIIASIGVAAAMPVAALAAKLSLNDSIVLVLAGTVLFAGLNMALRKPGLVQAIFVWLLLIACSQTLILAFSSLRLGVLVHTLAAVAGGVMIVALVWPGVRIGTPGAASLSIILIAVFAQGYNLGADSAPLWVRLGVMLLLLLSPLVFAISLRVLQSRTGMLVRPLVSACVSLAVAAIPAAIALAISAWAYMNVADSP